MSQEFIDLDEIKVEPIKKVCNRCSHAKVCIILLNLVKMTQQLMNQVEFIEQGIIEHQYKIAEFCGKFDYKTD